MLGTSVRTERLLKWYITNKLIEGNRTKNNEGQEAGKKYYKTDWRNGK
jgi:hypothetical protein